MKKILSILIILVPSFLFSQKKQKSTPKELIIKGINYGKNLIITNPFGDDGLGYGIDQLDINGVNSLIQSDNSVFEVDFKYYEKEKVYKVHLGDSINIRILYNSTFPPQVLNLECILNPNLESIPSLDNSSDGYYLNDKSICIIKGKTVFEEKRKFSPESDYFYVDLFKKVRDSLVNSFVSTTVDNFIFTAKFDELYELRITALNNIKRTNKTIKKIIIDLRGIPNNQKKGQLINFTLLIPKINDVRKLKLYSEFPVSKLYYNSVFQTLKWDEDYAKAITSASDILTKQITQENDLKEVELEGRLKQLEIEKNRSDLLSKGLEINNQKSEIEKQTLDKKIKEKEIKEKSLLINQEQEQKKYLYAIITVVFLITLGAIYAFFRQRKLRRLVDAQKTEVENQKHLVEEKHREITDSINYAERIQRSFLATKEQLENNLKDYFVFFQPKDVVSGDFYWAHTLNNGNFALVTADSTGHGVPGAIMSLLNTSSLEKAVELGITEPAEILNHTRKTIIDRLKKDGSIEGGKDGMDCSLISIDISKTKLTYSAANNPIWIIRDNAIIELTADKMPVGKHDRDSVSFTQHEIELQKGDMIYTLTDGFPDQFGGPKGKKFMYKHLKEVLISIAQLPMHEQKQLLKTTLNNWMGDLEQVDDVCLIGVRV